MMQINSMSGTIGNCYAKKQQCKKRVQQNNNQVQDIFISSAKTSKLQEPAFSGLTIRMEDIRQSLHPSCAKIVNESREGLEALAKKFPEQDLEIKPKVLFNQKENKKKGYLDLNPLKVIFSDARTNAEISAKGVDEGKIFQRNDDFITFFEPTETPYEGTPSEPKLTTSKAFLSEIESTFEYQQRLMYTPHVPLMTRQRSEGRDPVAQMFDDFVRLFVGDLW